MELTGLLSYGIFFLTLVSVYGLLSLGLNVQWGYVGMINIGVAAYFAVGAYASALITTPVTAVHPGLGLPFWLGPIVAMGCAAVLGLLIGLVTLRLRTDYLAIASIGIAEIVRLVLKNEAWLTNGVRGMPGIPRPFAGWYPPFPGLPYLILILLMILVVYLALQRAYGSPWGRVLRTLRDNETAARAMGKNALAFRLQAFVLGSAIMGLAGAVYAHFVGFISPEAFDPLFATFIVWVMLIAGGSGNNRGALLGAFLIWLVWSMSEFITMRLPPEITTQAGAVRIFLIGLLLQLILVFRPQGVLPERSPGR